MAEEANYVPFLDYLESGWVVSNHVIRLSIGEVIYWYLAFYLCEGMNGIIIWACRVREQRDPFKAKNPKKRLVFHWSSTVIVLKWKMKHGSKSTININANIGSFFNSRIFSLWLIGQHSFLSPSCVRINHWSVSAAKICYFEISADRPI